MSYCSIEEAWGAPFDADPSAAPTASHRSSSGSGKPRRRRSKRATRTSNANAGASAAYEGFANPPPPDAQPSPRVVTWGEQHWETPDPPHPDAHTRQFARELPSGQMPDALQVSLQGAPFEVEGQQSGDDGLGACAPAMTVVPNEAAAAAQASSDEGNGHGGDTRTPTPAEETPVESSSASPVIHEELDWMRNHLTHLTTQIETLSHKLDARATDDQGRTNGSADSGGAATTTDAMLYVVTGAFALVLLDVLFRAGQRSVSTAATV